MFHVILSKCGIVKLIKAVDLLRLAGLEPLLYSVTTCKREKKRCYKIPECTTLAALAFLSKAHTSTSRVFLAFEIRVFLSLICSGHHSQTEMDILYRYSEFYCVSLASAIQQWEQRFLLKISLAGELKKGPSQ